MFISSKLRRYEHFNQVNNIPSFTEFSVSARLFADDTVMIMSDNTMDKLNGSLLRSNLSERPTQETSWFPNRCCAFEYLREKREKREKR